MAQEESRSISANTTWGLGSSLLMAKKAVNKGEVTQYYVTDDHEAIIDKKTFDAVQVEIKNRERGYSGLNEFNSRARQVVKGI